MKNMKILFAPNPMPSHLIPLLSLAMRLDINRFKIAFLVSEYVHPFIEKKGFSHLGINCKFEEGLRPEIDAISVFNPDVMVDDLNPFTAFSSILCEIPRISVVRQGILPFESRNSDVPHSADVVVEHDKILALIDFDKLKLNKPKSISDLYQGDVNIIPSIPSIESLPIQLKQNKSYIYSGPLLLSDKDMVGSELPEEVVIATDKFLRENATKKIVYVDLGIYQPPIIIEKIEKCFHILFDQPNVVILSNYVGYKCRNKEEELRLFAYSFLPSNLICSKVDLMIHKCGSGSYNHQINNQIPSIIFGTSCYDRDEVALRLEELGAAKYISPNLDEEKYLKLFEEYVNQILFAPLSKKNEQHKILAGIKEEICTVQKQFDFEQIIINLLAKN